jgi:DNA gyrase subunit A
VVKRTNLSDFRNIRKDGINAITIAEGNDLVDVTLTNSNDEIVLITREGMSLRCHEDQFRAVGRTAQGVFGIRPGEGDFVVAMVRVDPTAALLVVSEKGIGKQTPFEDYRLQNRGGRGIITMKTSDRTGPVVGALSVHEKDQLMLMTSSGQSVRISVAQVRQAGRNTMGVKLMTLRGSEFIQDIAQVIAFGDEETETSPVLAEVELEGEPEAQAETEAEAAAETEEPS